MLKWVIPDIYHQNLEAACDSINSEAFQKRAANGVWQLTYESLLIIHRWYIQSASNFFSKNMSTLRPLLCAAFSTPHSSRHEQCFWFWRNIYLQQYLLAVILPSFQRYCFSAVLLFSNTASQWYFFAAVLLLATLFTISGNNIYLLSNISSKRCHKKKAKWGNAVGAVIWSWTIGLCLSRAWLESVLLCS